MNFVQCNAANYRVGRTQPVQYIVMHYTANNGDTARNNCDYYHRVGGLQASAHYFVYEYGAMQSVHEDDTAWHCGGAANATHIGIEMTEPASIVYTGHGAEWRDLDAAATETHIKGTYAAAWEVTSGEVVSTN